MTQDYRAVGDYSLSDISHIAANLGFQSYFTDCKAAQGFYSFYQQALTLWDRIPQSEFIHTRFGNTHILKLEAVLSGDSDTFLPQIIEESKNRPLVILLHGYGATSLMWQSIMPALADRWDCIALDIPGQLGLSDNQGDRIKISWQYATWLHEVIKNLGYESRELIVIGYSYGGNIAARFAARYKSHIKYLMLIEPAVIFNTIKLDFFRKFLNIHRKQLSVEEIELLFAEKTQFDYYNPLTDAALGLGFNYYAHTKFIIPLPVLSWKLTSLASRVSVFLAGQSEILNARRARWIAKLLIPFSRVQILPEATHSLPAQYSQEILAELFR